MYLVNKLIFSQSSPLNGDFRKIRLRLCIYYKKTTFHRKVLKRVLFWYSLTQDLVMVAISNNDSYITKSY